MSCYLKIKGLKVVAPESLYLIGGSGKTRTCDLYDVNVNVFIFPIFYLVLIYIIFLYFQTFLIDFCFLEFYLFYVFL